MESAPELLYVNSKITDTARMSPELFTSWYNDVHIPDIFKTSGITQAFRYHTTAKDPSSVERPYLALYPIKYEGYTKSKEFLAIPVKSDVLPGPSHLVFDVADFDTRYYRWTANQRAFEGPFVLTIQLEGDGGQLEAGEDAKFDSKAVFKWYFTRQNRKAPEESELGTSPANLVLVWLKTEEELEKAAEWAARFGIVATFKLIKAFSA